MRKSRILAVCLALGVLAMAGAQEQWKPEPAGKLLGAAQKQAGKEKKAVFVVFDASW